MNFGKSSEGANPYASKAYQINAASLVLDYKLDNQTDTYFGFMGTGYSGDKIDSSFWDSNSVVGVGVRYKF